MSVIIYTGKFMAVLFIMTENSSRVHCGTSLIIVCIAKKNIKEWNGFICKVVEWSLTLLNEQM